jgi:hypothetical protein
LEEFHFVRFNIYAGFVRKVQVFKEGMVYLGGMWRQSQYAQGWDNVSNWSVLFEYTNSRTLFPNLTTIIYQRLDHETCARWHRVLFSPSVRTLRLEPDSKGLKWSPETMSHMLSMTDPGATFIHELYVHPRGFRTDGLQGKGKHPALMHQQLFFGCLASLRNLRVLSSNAAALHPLALPVLGWLQHLETIKVDASKPPSLAYNIPLRDGSFPSLRQLSLQLIDNPSWGTGLFAMKPLFQNLRTVSFSLISTILDDPKFDENWLENFILRLCDSSPMLLNLSIYSPLRRHCGILSSRVRVSLSQLPLKRLSLRSISFAGGDVCKFLSSAWPDITSIRFETQRVGLIDLVPFAQNLPNLEQLKLDIDISGSYVPDHTAPTFPPLPRYTKLHCLSPVDAESDERSPEQTSNLAA